MSLPSSVKSENMNIILDKSYLLGSTYNSILELLSKGRLMMLESLFLEILTADEESDINKCFKKFPQRENPIDLLPHSGNLMYFEKTYHRPSVPLKDHVLKIKYEFNPCLRGNDYREIIKNVENALKEWKQDTSDRTYGFIQKATSVQYWFPELKDKKSISKQETATAMKRVSEDDKFIQNIYSELRKGILKNENEEWPEPKIINKDWAIFRYLQFHLIFALDYIWRHGLKEKEKSKKDTNAYIDIDYCILGSLADALATRDKIMGDFYRIVCPEKILIK